MSLNAIVNNGISTAFHMLGDLKKDVTFHRRTNENSYDFTNRIASAASEEDIVVSAVVLQDNKVNDQFTNTRKLQLLYRTSDVGDLATFDRVTVDGTYWRISNSPLSSTGHISFVECIQEVARGQT